MLGILKSIILPRLCSGCGSVLEHGAICAACLMQLPRTGVHLAKDNQVRPILDNGPAPAGFTAAWFAYNPAHSRADFIRHAKYMGRPRQARELGRVFAAELMADAPAGYASGLFTIADVDALLPVPMWWGKRVGRGYNQACEIARGISEVCGIPVADNLVALSPHRSQTTLGATGRRSNIEGCFGVVYPDELSDLHVAIVDDIITTGATLGECVLALGRSGARPSAIGAISLGMAGLNS